MSQRGHATTKLNSRKFRNCLYAQTHRRVTIAAESLSSFFTRGEPMLRIFKVYYPIRTLVLILGEILIAWSSLLLATILAARDNSYFALNDDFGYHKIITITFLVILLSHWFDFYDSAKFGGHSEFYIRPVMIPGLLAIGVAG